MTGKSITDGTPVGRWCTRMKKVAAAGAWKALGQEVGAHPSPGSVKECCSGTALKEIAAAYWTSLAERWAGDTHRRVGKNIRAALARCRAEITTRPSPVLLELAAVLAELDAAVGDAKRGRHITALAAPLQDRLPDLV